MSTNYKLPSPQHYTNPTGLVYSMYHIFDFQYACKSTRIRHYRIDMYSKTILRCKYGFLLRLYMSLLIVYSTSLAYLHASVVNWLASSP